MKRSRRIRGALIGCGYFGQIHLEAWRRMPEVEIVAACDLNLEHARDAAPRAYSSPERMLEREQLDFVDVATRPESHVELVQLAAAKKLPIICQKPMARTWEDAVTMVAAAEAAGVPFMIHENWRWQPWYRAVKQMIEQGDIGQPINYWFGPRSRDGTGAQPYAKQSYFRQLPRFLIDEMLVHLIDTACFLFGDIAAVYAQGRRINPVIAGEDQALLIITHSSGLLGSIDGHRFLDTQPSGPVLGDAGFEGDSGALILTPEGTLYRGSDKVWAGDQKVGYRGDSMRDQQHFVSCLELGNEFETSGRVYLKTFAVVQAAYTSWENGNRVSLTDSRWTMSPILRPHAITDLPV